MESDLARYKDDKLQRWAKVLSMFKYQIEAISGNNNVWGDLLSRWGATQEIRTVQTATVILLAVARQKIVEAPVIVGHTMVDIRKA